MDVTNSGQTAVPKKTIEDTYQKKSQLEHILLRPDTYIGCARRVFFGHHLYGAYQLCRTKYRQDVGDQRRNSKDGAAGAQFCARTVQNL